MKCGLFLSRWYLPKRVHGTGLFNRGLTQVLFVLSAHRRCPTLNDDLQMDLEKKRYYIITISLPLGGETKPMRAPGRREIGHGALAERALLPVLPPKEDFPTYSGGVGNPFFQRFHLYGVSLGSTLALMDAEFPSPSPSAERQWA